MFNKLHHHPFPVVAHFDYSLVLTFSALKEQLQHLLPDCLSLDTYKDKYAFLAVAMVQTKGLRPKGFPEFIGNDFFLIGYRIFVNYTNLSGRKQRGLYILKSETDKKKMEFLGNIFTKYKYTTTDISRSKNENSIEISSIASDFRISIDCTDQDIPLPEGSPFLDWKEARKFSGPLPFTFSCENQQKNVLIIEGKRKNWNPQPVRVKRYRISFLENMPDLGLELANAFIIRDVSYSWKKGRIEKWK